MPRLIRVFAGRTCHFVGFLMRQLNYLILSLHSGRHLQTYELSDRKMSLIIYAQRHINGTIANSVNPQVAVTVAVLIRRPYPVVGTVARWVRPDGMNMQPRNF